MKSNNSPFRFKQFSVNHHRSAMKVGVDGVLLGSWADVDGVKKVLDVGCGCGLIALMIAQRCLEAKVFGIEIDKESVEEALENVNSSPWHDRIKILHGDFIDNNSLEKEEGFDLIISNPPYFDSGVAEIVTSRERARHQGVLSPSSILVASIPILSNKGSVAMIIPAELSETLENQAKNLGYFLSRKCCVRGHSDSPFKRMMLQWKFGKIPENTTIVQTEYLTLETQRGVPTEEYRALCKDFYLKF